MDNKFKKDYKQTIISYVTLRDDRLGLRPTCTKPHTNGIRENMCAPGKKKKIQFICLKSKTERRPRTVVNIANTAL